MKRLLKLCVVAVVLVLGVSSCMKEDDSLQWRMSISYILQTESGKFTPQIRLESYDGEFKSASLSIEGKKINFEPLNVNVWELPSSSYSGGGLPEYDTISSVGVIDLVGINGQIESRSIGTFSASKPIGAISSSLEYSDTEKELNVKLNALVENADSYHLMYKSLISESSSSYTMWMPLLYGELTEIKGESLSQKISFKNIIGTYKFAVAAITGQIVKVDEVSAREITLKK